MNGQRQDGSDSYAVPDSGVPLCQEATANINPWTEDQVDTKNPDRGPMLITSGEKDNTVPGAISHATFKLQEKNHGLTVYHEIVGRGHSLTIDHALIMH
jgi:non-heme chloroperoxidase